MGGKCLKRKWNSKENMEKLMDSKFLEIINKDYNDNHKVYFEIINEKIRKFYFDNRNSQMNISLSLDKKDFSSISSAKIFSMNPSKQIIHWKDYLLEFIDKKSKKGCKWIKKLRS